MNFPVFDRRVDGNPFDWIMRNAAEFRAARQAENDVLRIKRSLAHDADVKKIKREEAALARFGNRKR